MSKLKKMFLLYQKMRQEILLTENQSGIDLLLNIKKLIYKFLLVNLIVNFFTWFNYTNNNFYWFVILNAYAIGGGILFYLFSIILFSKEKAFVIFFIIRCLDIPSNLADVGYVDKFDSYFDAIKLILNIIVLYLVLGELYSKIKHIQDLIKNKIDFYILKISLTLTKIIEKF